MIKNPITTNEISLDKFVQSNKNLWTMYMTKEEDELQN